MTGVNLSDAKPYVDNPHSNFDLSFKRKFDSKIGDWNPVMYLPVMPSDKISISSEVLMRMAPFVQQVFQDYKVSLDFFYVPNRVLWHNFDKYLCGGYDGMQEYIAPYIDFANSNLQGFINASAPYGVFNMMDVPAYFMGTRYLGDKKINALPLAAFIRCMLDFNLPAAQTTLTSLREQYANDQLLSDGDNTVSLLNLFIKLQTNNVNARLADIPDDAAYAFELPQRLYPIDYFTGARPNTQFGPVMTIPINLVSKDTTGTQTFEVLNAAGSAVSQPLYMHTTAGSKSISVSNANNPTSNAARVVINGSVFGNTATINDFYSAARLQELFQVYGYTGYSCSDKVAAEFGVRNPNASLQRAQFLFHDTMDVAIGEVFSNDVNVPNSEGALTDIPGSGTAIGKLNGFSNGFNFSVPEHGFIIGVCSCYPEASYFQGLPRIYSQLDRFDYPHPLFSELGMQSIKKKEIVINSANSNAELDFAYRDRYGDYKCGINRVNGALQDSLSSMSAGRDFEYEQPGGTLQSVVFNDRFLRVDPRFNGLNRTFNVTSDYPMDKPLFFDINFKIDAYRPLPYYGLPKF